MATIDWSTVTHAYGDASDVPELLEALTSDDPDERESALHELNGNIWHQGTVYEATAHAVPGLVAAATGAGGGDRPAILDLIKRIYHGQSYNKQHEHMESEATLADPEFQKQMAKELAWVDAARAAVEAERGALLGLIDDDDPDVRSGAIAVLCSLKGDDALERLEARIPKEDDEVVRATLVATLSIVEPTYAREKLEAFLADDSLLVAREAGVNLCYLLKGETPMAVAERLVEVVLASGPLEEAYARMPYRQRGLSFDTCGELSRLATVLDGLSAKMAKAISDADPAIALNLFATTAWRAKDQGDMAVFLDAFRRWLASEANFEVPNVRETLIELDFPSERAALVAALDEGADTVDQLRALAIARSSAGVLNQELTIGDESKTAGEWWTHLADPEVTEPTIESLVAALTDALDGEAIVHALWHLTQLQRLGQDGAANARVLATSIGEAGDPAALMARASELAEQGPPQRVVRPGVMSIATQLFQYVLGAAVAMIEAGRLAPSETLAAVAQAAKRRGAAADAIERYEGLRQS